ncbi:sensor histidine kinase [Streptomyces sp. cmx-18-6]|uniref:sensor histidine kinase n=1 Tax=Streptomyces sp. cmx-18-6 TaxID=2790930 RepID=UPI00397EF1F4
MPPAETERADRPDRSDRSDRTDRPDTADRPPEPAASPDPAEALAPAPTPALPPTPRIARVLDAFGLPASRQARRSLAYAVLDLVPAVLGLLVVPLLAVALLLSASFIGLRGVSAMLVVPRGLAAVHRFLLRTLLGEDIPAPHPGDGSRGGSRRGSLGGSRGGPRGASDPGGWRAAAHAVLVAPLAVVSVVVQLALRSYGLVGVCYVLWYRELEERGDGRRGLVLPGSDAPLDTWPGILAVTVAGLLLLAVSGWLGRRLDGLTRFAGRALLGPSALAERVSTLEETRALALRDSAATLRRIERDLHDGAQARLVAVAMTLTRAHAALSRTHRTEADADRARDLVGQALGNSRSAIEELRDLVRGIHPPVLDTGLDAALASLAGDVEASGTPVRVHADLPARLPESVETIAYFCAAELLANVTRHAAAASAEVRAEVRGGALV